MTTTRPALLPRITAAATALALTLGTALSGGTAVANPAVSPASVAGAPAASPLGSLSPVAPCPGPAPRVSVFGQPGTPVVGWRENLVFDGRGRMWVSHSMENAVVAYDADGRRMASVPIGFPAGLALSPTGEVLVVTEPMAWAPRSTIYAFDPDAAVGGPAAPAPRAVASLPSGMNGLAVDAAGTMYTTGMFATHVTKVLPDGRIDRAWTDAAAVFGTNGIAIAGDTAYVSVTTSVDTVIHALPLADPAAGRAMVLTRPPELARGLDDLAVTADAVYAVGMTGGELLRIDRASGAACVVAAGLTGPTSVRVAEGFGGFGDRDLFVTSVDGTIRHVALP